MADLIRLLPDSVANQIAAGEVIQRPASAVKELLENAIDAGATEIELILKDAGRTLIQLVDNGCGMSGMDARMCFERHATSKITRADDLFRIRTLGFRGEALASIAAISQVELKTRKQEDEIGTCLIVEGSEVKSQTACSCPAGTSIQVKNLFFNVPARRNFLKSNRAEIRHIIDDFYRIAMVYNNVRFSMYHNDKLLHQLFPSNRKQRIVGLLGQQYNQRLIPVDHDTDDLKITGFIGKPEFARKKRGEQYFFVNGRYIRHPYLNHSLENAFHELLPADSYPTYIIYIDVDPKNIDVNIHPTKTEVNFLDSKLIYAVLKSAVKMALGKHSITPTIDFDVEQSLDLAPPDPGREIKNPFDRPEKQFNPFEQSSPAGFGDPRRQKKINIENWEKLYDTSGTQTEIPESVSVTSAWQQDEAENGQVKVFQVQNNFIVTSIKTGIVIINQHNAHERILYEQFLDRLKNEKKASQQELFPRNITFSSSDVEIVNELLDEFNILGYHLNKLSQNTFVVNGVPEGMQDEDLQEALDQVLENYKQNLLELNLNKKINLARSMAVRMAIRPGKRLHIEEMDRIIDELFACQVPEITPDGAKTYTILKTDDLKELFK